jgi:hypothetical protein
MVRMKETPLPGSVTCCISIPVLVASRDTQVHVEAHSTEVSVMVPLVTEYWSKLNGALCAAAEPARAEPEISNPPADAIAKAIYLRFMITLLSRRR